MTASTLDDAVFDRLLRQRTIVLGQEVGDPVAYRIVGQLLVLASEEATADITLCINFPGSPATP